MANHLNEKKWILGYAFLKHFYIAFDGESKQIGIAKVIGSEATISSEPFSVNLSVMLVITLIILMVIAYCAFKERIQGHKIKLREEIRLKRCLSDNDGTSDLIFPIITNRDLKLKLTLPPKSQTSSSYLMN